VNKRILLLSALLFVSTGFGQQIALLKYQGGGDWYANITTSLPNLIDFANKNIHTDISDKVPEVTPDSPEIYNYPYIHMTGHGNVLFSEEEINNLRKYLLSGGFLHIDDNYGMDKYIRREIKKLFPDNELKELSKDHPVFHSFYDFPKGLPKIHEHDGNRPQAYGITDQNGRLILLYTFESDLGDGWESPEIHNDPPEIREKALKMGANILYYVFTN